MVSKHEEPLFLIFVLALAAVVTATTVDDAVKSRRQNFVNRHLRQGPPVAPGPRPPIIQNRFSGGQDASRDIYPFTAYIWYTHWGMWCPATCVKIDGQNYTFFTHAWCASGWTVDDYPDLTIEWTNPMSERPKENETLHIKSMVPHPNYNSTTGQNAVAIINAEAPSNVTISSIQAIECCPPDLKQPNATGKALSWGARNSNEWDYDYMQEINSTIIDTSDCRDIYAGVNWEIYASEYCATGEPWVGDEGAPHVLAYKITTLGGIPWCLAGLLSAYYAEGDQDRPYILSDVCSMYSSTGF